MTTRRHERGTVREARVHPVVVSAWPARVRARLTADPEAGMSTAEYAVGTVAACAFAAVLYSVVTGASVVTAMSGLVADALATLS
ncbi:DUF4244 domain-containing protein [Geodermatophilus sp. Leaf369]|uniref:DUF4244 domain-containing protein n=1 Tax=Geodermatophilus sp. Leaf369 TaxID=1736354 RepID=UPI0009EA1FD7|nr:DUF4244 domain-containing protein [Geodermatophilus sp. Leaf369]